MTHFSSFIPIKLLRQLTAMSTKYGGKMRVSSCNCITVKVYFYEKQLILSCYFSTVLEGMSRAFLAELSPEESAPLFLGCANRKRELLGPAPALLSGVKGVCQERDPMCWSPGSGPMAAKRPAAPRLQGARRPTRSPRRPTRARAAGPGTHPRSASAWGPTPPRPAHASGVLRAPRPRGGFVAQPWGSRRRVWGGAGVPPPGRWGSGLLPREGGQGGVGAAPGEGEAGGDVGRQKDVQL